MNLLQPRPVVLQGMQVRRVPLEIPEVRSLPLGKNLQEGQGWGPGHGALIQVPRGTGSLVRSSGPLWGLS